MKPFAYSVFLRDFEYQKRKIKLSELAITVSSIDMEYMLYVFNGIQSLSTYQTGDHVWERTGIRMLKEWEVKSETIYCKTLSPILIENKERNPVHPHDSEYAKEFQYYAELRIRELKGREPYKSIGVEPLNMKKVVIKETNSTFQKQCKEQRYLIFTLIAAISS